MLDREFVVDRPITFVHVGYNFVDQLIIFECENLTTGYSWFIIIFFKIK